MEPFLGQIMSFAGNFAPVYWMQCTGQLMSISQNTALFSLLGTQFGGNGQTTFALPDLRGRRIIGQGQGPGLQMYDIGEASGTETKTLLTSNLPPHNHIISLQCDVENSGETNPQNNYLGTSGESIYSAGASSRMATLPLACSITGGSQPFNILTPYLALTQCIAVEGIYPSRN